MDYDREKEMFMRRRWREAGCPRQWWNTNWLCFGLEMNWIIGHGHNARENCMGGHACGNRAAMRGQSAWNSWRLLDTTLLQLLSPVMSSGAISLARIPKVIYGAKTRNSGLRVVSMIFWRIGRSSIIEVESGLWRMCSDYAELFQKS